MKIIFQILLIISISFGFNKSINDKIEEQWIQLFNGENLDGWEVKINGFPLGENAFNTFRVKNKSLVVNYDDYDNFMIHFLDSPSTTSSTTYKLQFRGTYNPNIRINRSQDNGSAYGTASSASITAIEIGA